MLMAWCLRPRGGLHGDLTPWPRVCGLRQKAPGAGPWPRSPVLSLGLLPPDLLLGWEACGWQVSLSASGPWRSPELLFIRAEGLPEDGPGQEGRDGSTPGQSHGEEGLGALADIMKLVWVSAPLLSVSPVWGSFSGRLLVKVGRPLTCYIRFNNVVGFPLVSC